jgi:hypothetical protein
MTLYSRSRRLVLTFSVFGPERRELQTVGPHARWQAVRDGISSKAVGLGSDTSSNQHCP